MIKSKVKYKNIRTQIIYRNTIKHRIKSISDHNSIKTEEVKLFHMLALINVGLSYESISYFEPTKVKALRFKSDSVFSTKLSEE